MPNDHYSPCPCGSGKKIKFCCGDLAGEIDRVIRMIEGEQRIAALRLLNQLLDKNPDRIALLEIKSGLALSMGLPDDANDAIDRILARQPDHPNALARRAIQLADCDETHAAVATLQRAMRHKDGVVSHAMLEAALHVGETLQYEGHLFAAKAHYQLHLHAQPAGSRDNRSAAALVQMHHHGGLPLLVRDDLHLKECPKDAPWAKEFESAIEDAWKAAWETSAEKFEKLLAESDDAPEVVYNLAVVRAWLGRTRELVDGLRQYARLDAPEEDRIEALALANVLDHARPENSVDRCRWTYDVADAEGLVAKLAAEPSVSQLTDEMAGPDLAEHDGEGPPPLGKFILLDRPMPPHSEKMTYDDVPQVLGLMLVYGKETDQLGRLEFNAPKTATIDAALARLDEVTGAARGDLRSEETIGVLDRVYAAMTPRLRIPDDLPPKHQVEIMREQTRRSIVEIWPTVPQHALSGKTPEEASRDPALRIDLLAAFLIFETTSIAAGAPNAVAALREKLGIAPPETLSPERSRDSAFNPWRIPLIRVLRLDLLSVSDDELVQLWRRALFFGASQVVTHIAREAVRRPGLEPNRINRLEAYQELVRAQEDTKAAQAIINEAREATTEFDNAAAIWDLTEFAVCLRNGDIEDVERLMHHLGATYPNDAFVANGVREIFAAHGVNLGPPDEEGTLPADVGSMEAALEDAGAPASAIWTPDSAASGAPKAGEKREIWTP